MMHCSNPSAQTHAARPVNLLGTGKLWKQLCPLRVPDAALCHFQKGRVLTLLLALLQPLPLPCFPLLTTCLQPMQTCASHKHYSSKLSSLLPFLPLLRVWRQHRTWAQRTLYVSSLSKTLTSARGSCQVCCMNKCLGVQCHRHRGGCNAWQQAPLLCTTIENIKPHKQRMPCHRDWQPGAAAGP